MSPYIIFAIGSLSGCALAVFCCAVYHSQKMQEARDEFSSLREAIRRNAYARGYEQAKAGEVKRA